MFNVLIINQKGGVGKTTVADELAFALERRKKSVGFVSIDPQGGALHETRTADDVDFQVIDTAGVMTDQIKDWCKEADMVIIPMLASSRDLEPTLRTYTMAKESGGDAQIGFIINGYFARGVLDKAITDYLKEEGCLIWAKIPKTVALPQAALRGVSIADYDRDNPACEAFNTLARKIVFLSKKQVKGR